jgi:hypothetical protein
VRKDFVKESGETNALEDHSLPGWDSKHLLALLSAELARKVGFENAYRIFHLTR